MEVSQSKLFASIVTFGLLSVVLLPAFTSGSDPRWADGVLTGDEMHLYEKVVFFVGLIAILTNWIISTHSSFALGHKGWRWWNLFFWPATFIYIWVYATGRLPKVEHHDAA